MYKYKFFKNDGQILHCQFYEKPVLTWLNFWFEFKIFHTI